MNEPRCLKWNSSPNAEKLWVNIAQRLFAKNNNLQKQFDVFLYEDGVWRCGGCLSNADIPFAARRPVLLPRDHHLTTLVVRRAHQRVLHNGVKATLSKVRSRYWIVKGRSFVTKVVHQWVICKRFEARLFLGPSPPPLPNFRLREDLLRLRENSLTRGWIMRDPCMLSVLTMLMTVRFGSAFIIAVSFELSTFMWFPT